jgi:hypothetical protein
MKIRRGTRKVGGSVAEVILTGSDFQEILRLQKILIGAPTVIQKIMIEYETLSPLINKVKEMLKITGYPAQGMSVDISNFSLTRDDTQPIRDMYQKFTTRERTAVNRVIPRVLHSLWTKILGKTRQAPRAGDFITKADLEPIVVVQNILTGPGESVEQFSSGSGQPGSSFIQKTLEQFSSPALSPLMNKVREMVKFTDISPGEPEKGRYLDISSFSLTIDDIMPLRDMFYKFEHKEKYAVKLMIPTYFTTLFNKILGFGKQSRTGTGAFLTTVDLEPIVAVYQVIVVPEPNFIQKTLDVLGTLLPLQEKLTGMVKVLPFNPTDPLQGVHVDLSNLSLTRGDVTPVRDIYSKFTPEEKGAFNKIIPQVLSPIWHKIISS